MTTRFAPVLVLLMLAASDATASHGNPLVAPTTPWAAHIREVDEALARKNVGSAQRAWRDAYLAAFESQPWEGMVEVGDAALRIGAVAGLRQTGEATARWAYLAALSRARRLASLEGVLRTAEAFAALGDHEVVEQCLRVAESVAREARTPGARNRVRAFKAEWAGTKWGEGR